MYLGDLLLSQTLDFKFCTKNLSDVPTTLAGSPVLSVYQANSTTPIDPAEDNLTLTVDFDGITGLNHVRILTEEFYAAGNFQVVCTTGTVNGVSYVGTVVAQFSIGSRNQSADVLKISGDTTAANNAESFFDGTGYAGTNNVMPTVTTIATDGVTGTSLSAGAIADIAAAALASADAAIADAFTFDGPYVQADMREINGDMTNGANATLSLAALNINNSGGPAITLTGSTSGVFVSAGTTALLLSGGDYGLNATGVLAGIRADCASNGPGLECVGGGGGSSEGARFIGGSTGVGVKMSGGDSAHGLHIIGGVGGGNADGIRAEKAGTGVDIRGYLTGNITGNLSGSVNNVVAGVGGAVASVTLVNGLAANVITAASMNPDASTEIATQVNTTLGAAHGTGAWGPLPGTGAFAVTITVNDGTDPIQNVSFAIYDAGTLVASGTTDGLGNATRSLSAGTYTIDLVKANYTFATATRTVTGNQAGSLITPLSMTIISGIVPPVDPAMCVVAGYLIDTEGAPALNAVLKIRLVPASAERPITANSQVVSLETVQVIANGAGFITVELIRTDELDDPNCAYAFSCEAAQIDATGVRLESATFDLADL